MGSEKPSLEGLKINRDQAGRGPGVFFWTVAIIVAIAIGAAIFLLWPRQRAIPVKTAVAEKADASPESARTVLNASGYVTARLEATVSSKTTGKVKQVLVEEGMKVKAGQVLARLDDSNVRASYEVAVAQVKAAQSAMDETRVRLAEAEKQLRRTKALAADHVSSVSDLDSAEADVNSYRAHLINQKSQVLVAQRQVALLQQDLDDTVIRAPFAGVVVSKNAQPGEMISPISAGGGFTRTGICTVVDMKSLEIDVDVNENYITRVKADQPVTATLDAYPDWKIPAHVIAIVPTADRQKATVPVRIAFEKLDPRILPDMGVKVAFQEEPDAKPTQIAKGVSIPEKAIHQQDGHTIVWVVENHRLERRAVSVGERRDGRAFVLAGLNPGELVVTGSDGKQLTDGLRVTEQAGVN